MTSFLCFGEALWDMPPGEKIPGGAPMNVALRLARFGADVRFVSRVGDDELGRDLVAFMEREGLGTGSIQRDPAHPTGRVLVDASDPTAVKYDIERPAAWDFIEPVVSEGPAAGPDVLVFGSLAMRSEVSHGSLRTLLGEARLRVFDINLRPPFVDREVIEALIGRSDWVKLNGDELDVVGGWWSLSGSIEERATAMAERFGLETVCVTLGADGAVLLHEGEVVRHPGFQVEVVDTIGCGDSFLAAWLWKMHEGAAPADALAYAGAVGALVATHAGANPALSEQGIEEMLRSG